MDLPAEFAAIHVNVNDRNRPLNIWIRRTVTISLMVFKILSSSKCLLSEIGWNLSLDLETKRKIQLLDK